ncbi:hypothetical protein HHI36_020860 [Cryptolaemus montrouzieri]|uniref:Uncharacterized protein n=1 Tax=Cryptolaemus montrouzieri TaxID=559131 RepID=A0ABD2NBL1_9CUCU
MMRFINNIIILIILILGVTKGTPVENITENANDTDSEPKDLYVFKTVIYEIGVLTNVTDDNVTDGNATQEKVEVSFYTPNNHSLFNLSNIPTPIQTNVSSVAATGFLPTNLKALIADNSSSSVILPKEELKVTKNLSTSNPDAGNHIVSQLPQILGFDGKNDNSTKETV